MMENALHRLPCLADAQVRMLLNGPESFTPDGSFLLGETAETSGLFLGCGMNSVGVATGGGAGMALAHCIVNGHTPTDLSEADPKRFADCFNSAKLLSERTPQVLGEHYAIHYPGYQWSTARDLRHTAAHSIWQQHNAHFGQFFGWERPLYFNKVAEPVLTMDKPDWFNHVQSEVNNAHTKAALFDSSSFGKIEIAGSDAEAFLQRTCCNNMKREPGRAIYTGLLNERGGYESDLIALRISNDTYHLYTGTSAIKKDLAWLKKHKNINDSVAIKDITEDLCVYALMGPDSTDIVSQLGAENLSTLGFYRHCETSLNNIAVRATRISYVGEAGWELTCRTTDAAQLCSDLIKAGAQPAGAFAQTSMRIEKGFLAFGHDLDADINPLQAGLSHTVDFSKSFIGRDALQQALNSELSACIATMVLDDQNAVPIGNEPVYSNDRIVGKSTSAAFGYRVGRPVALVLLSDTEIIQRIQNNGAVGAALDIARSRYTGQITTKPALH
jgi:4-methylaminobutanoate oxidase (formaldehyde-forming)